MARKASTPASPVEPPLLTKPREKVRSEIGSQIERGRSLVSTTSQTIDVFSTEAHAWRSYTTELLRRAFTTTEYSEAFKRVGVGMFMFMGHRSHQERYRDLVGMVTNELNYLTSLAGTLDLIEEVSTLAVEASPTAPSRLPSKQRSETSRRVFVVHGRDETPRLLVSRFLEQCKLKPIVLHEQADGGRTIIEKIEAYSDVDFAVVLLTPDDEGRLRSTQDAQLIPARR